MNNLVNMSSVNDFTDPAIKRRIKEIEKFYDECQQQRLYNLDRTGKIHPQCFFVNSKLVSDLRKKSAVEKMPKILHRLRHPIYFVQN